MGFIKEDKQRVVFYWDKDEEEPIVRSLQGPNISEQKMITKQVARKKVDAFVTECMAVNPDYQTIFQDGFVKANITIITNVIKVPSIAIGGTFISTYRGLVHSSV